MFNLKKKMFFEMIWILFYLDRYITCYGGDVSMYNSKRKFKYILFNFYDYYYLMEDTSNRLSVRGISNHPLAIHTKDSKR